MPELPEVEIIVQELNASHLIGKKILKAEVFWNRTIATPSVRQFLKEIEGQDMLKIIRQGKYIVFHLSDGYLLIHLRMTGKFLLPYLLITNVFGFIWTMVEFSIMRISANSAVFPWLQL